MGWNHETNVECADSVNHHRPCVRLPPDVKSSKPYFPQHAAVAMATETQRSSSSASAASNEDVRVATKTADAVDLCRVTVVSETCSQERNCSECMDVAVPERPDGCFLDATSGICQSFNQLKLTQQTINGSAAASSSSSSQQWQALETVSVFSSTHRQYCKPLDLACVLCAKVAASAQFVPSIDELKSMSVDRRVCYGDDGCICVAACQSAERISFTSTRCPVPTPQPVSTQSIMGNPSIQVTIVAVLGCFLLVRCISEYLRIHWARQRAERRAAVTAVAGGNGSDRSTRPAREKVVTSLRLSGWIAWHHELRELEKNGELRYVNLQTPMPRETELSSSSHFEVDHDVVMLEPRSSNVI